MEDGEDKGRRTRMGRTRVEDGENKGRGTRMEDGEDKGRRTRMGRTRVEDGENKGREDKDGGWGGQGRGGGTRMWRTRVDVTRTGGVLTCDISLPLVSHLAGRAPGLRNKSLKLPKERSKRETPHN